MHVYMVHKWGNGRGDKGTMDSGGEGTKAVWTRRDGKETLKGAIGAADKERGVQGAGKKVRGDEG